LTLRILVDGKEVYTSGVVSRASFGLAQSLDIPVIGANELTLIVEAADGNNGGDHANWADAYLVH
jgi:tRNA A37 threonylcarbamoyladenosine modification protein TsaB